MASDLLEKDLKAELQRRFTPVLEKDVLSHPEYNLALLRLQTLAPGGNNKWEDQNLGDLLHLLTPRPCSAGLGVMEADIGDGGDWLGRRILWSWLRDDVHTFPKLLEYKMVFGIEFDHLSQPGLWETLRKVIPETLTRWGGTQVAEWFEEGKSLIIVFKMQFNELEKYFYEGIIQTLEDFPHTSTLFIVNRSVHDELLKCLVNWNKLDVVQLKLAPMKIPAITGVANKLLIQNSSAIRAVEKKLEMVEWFSELMSAPGVACDTMKCIDQDSQLINTDSEEELIWTIFINKVMILKYQGMLRETTTEHILNVLSTYAYKFGCKCNWFEIQEYLLANISLSSDKCHSVLASLLYARNQLPPGSGTEYFPTYKQQWQALAAWYAIERSKESYPLQKLLLRLSSWEKVAQMVAGHLIRLTLNGEFRPEDMPCLRIIRNQSKLIEHSSDPQSYVIRLLHEMKPIPFFNQKFLEDAIFPRQIEIFESSVYPKALELFVSHAEPSRILIIIRNLFTKSDALLPVFQPLVQKDIHIGLALMNHLEWGSPQTSNGCLQVFIQSHTKACLQDFIGCLTTSMLLELISPINLPKLRHLVCLRVRVIELPAVQILLSLQSCLPALMWLEIDFDFELKNLAIKELPSITTPLVDLSFHGISSTDMSTVSSILAHFRNAYYSGIHLHKTNLSPLSVFEFFYKLQKQGIRLITDRNAVARYRQWRFPELSVLSQAEMMDDAKVQHLLGYDDRQHYSDNEVRSSAYITFQEARRFAGKLQTMETVQYFQYGCVNYLIEKNCNGTTKIQKLM